MATGNTFHFADLLHCPYLTQLFPKRWITGYAEFHPSDGNNVNLLSLVGELALFSHKVPLNKLLLLNGTTVTSKVLFFFFFRFLFLSSSNPPFVGNFLPTEGKKEFICWETLYSISINQYSKNCMLLLLQPFYIILSPNFRT